jgi:hypothetical protein
MFLAQDFYSSRGGLGKALEQPRFGQLQFFLGLGPLLIAGLLAAGFAAPLEPALAQASGPTAPLRPATACPTELERLIGGLLRDLPTYANLVASRTLGSISPTDWPFDSVVLVSSPEYAPIDLSDRTFRDLSNADPAVQQVFFTTLERQFVNSESVLLQHYHWLFLAPSDRGWQLAFMYSSIGPYPADRQPPSPPQESSSGIIGQAVGLWLRDCRAGSVASVSADSP